MFLRCTWVFSLAHVLPDSFDEEGSVAYTAAWGQLRCASFTSAEFFCLPSLFTMVEIELALEKQNQFNSVNIFNILNEMQ